MALRNHLLDSRIEESAFSEFMEKGYQNASLRKIAENAGVTVGAIRTRYKTKDDLFCSLLSALVSGIVEAFSNLKAQYYSLSSSSLAEHLKASMEMEGEAIITLIFDNYREAKLLLCRSEGSSMEGFFRRITDEKAGQSIIFFRSLGCRIDENAVRLLITSQFICYQKIVEADLDRKDAEECIRIAHLYHYSGWLSVIEHIGGGA